MKNNRFASCIASTVLALTGLFGVSASAIAQVAIEDGLYVINVSYYPENEGIYSYYGGCMIVGNNGYDAVPSLYYWNKPNGTWCGLSDDRGEVLRNRQAVWEVYAVKAENGMRAHVLKSHVNGRCLARGQDSRASTPSLHLWSLPGGDPKYCGFRSAAELIKDGQAAWSLDTMVIHPDLFIAYAISAGRTPHRRALGFPRPSTFPAVWGGTHASFTSGASHWMFEFWRAND